MNNPNTNDPNAGSNPYAGVQPPGPGASDPYSGYGQGDQTFGGASQTQPGSGHGEQTHAFGGASQQDPTSQFGQASQFDQTQQYGQTQQFGQASQTQQFGQASQFDQTQQYGQTQQFGQASQFDQTQQYGQQPGYGGGAQDVTPYASPVPQQAPPAYAQGGYGQAPGYGGYEGYPGYGAPLTPVARPMTVIIASILVWLVSALFALGPLVVLLVGGSMWSQIALPGYPDVGQMIMGVLIFVVVIFVLFAGLYAGLAIGAFRGSNGARWTLVSFLFLSVLLTLMGMLEQVSVMNFIVLAVLVAMPVLYMLPASSNWYRYETAKRLAQQGTYR